MLDQLDRPHVPTLPFRLREVSFCQLSSTAIVSFKLLKLLDSPLDLLPACFWHSFIAHSSSVGGRYTLVAR